VCVCVRVSVYVWVWLNKMATNVEREFEQEIIEEEKENVLSSGSVHNKQIELGSNKFYVHVIAKYL